MVSFLLAAFASKSSSRGVESEGGGGEKEGRRRRATWWWSRSVRAAAELGFRVVGGGRPPPAIEEVRGWGATVQPAVDGGTMVRQGYRLGHGWRAGPVGAVYWEEVEVVARSPREESGRWEKDEEGGAGQRG
jgi:hypothetical protein